MKRKIFWIVSEIDIFLDQNTYKTLMSSDVLGCVPINTDIN